MRTLVVEDDALNLAVITKFLEMSGVTRVDTAADGAEGAEALTEGSYDFVLTDVHMPVMSGLDMIRTVAVRGRSGGLQSGFACRDLWVGSKFAASPPLPPPSPWYRHVRTGIPTFEPVWTVPTWLS